MQNLILTLPIMKGASSSNICSIDNLVGKAETQGGTPGPHATPILPPVKGLLFNNKQLPPLASFSYQSLQQQGLKNEQSMSQSSQIQQLSQVQQSHAAALILAQSAMTSNPFEHLSQLLSHIESSSSGAKSITGHEVADKIIRDNGDYSLQLKEIFGSLRDIHLSLLNWPMVQYSQDIPVGEIMRELVSFIEYRDLEKLEFLMDKFKRQLDLVKYWKYKLGHLYVEKVGNGVWSSPGDKNRSEGLETNNGPTPALDTSASRLTSPTPSVSLGAGIISGVSGGSTAASSRSVSYSVPTEERVGHIPEHAGEYQNNFFQDMIVPSWFIVIRDPKSMNCLQCGSRDTSEWRSGPLGRKSMCNACGIWYMKLKQRFGEEDAAVIMEYRRLTNRHDDRRVPKKFEVPLPEVEKVKRAIRARVVAYLNEVEIPVKTRRRALLHKGKVGGTQQTKATGMKTPQ
ncbi:HCL343Cp [Eremothecium sinecaudum]|uniref:HCL343Cp n=1 Tax=Eremothecium sinecaudum TaxID=45286 RepID=A0A109UYJ0_9SACH|nr:HCL343Cp [Eremothecium sinecaudum]AMD19808.1 HCL343Cp [Eremothecium sinecaudum]